MKNYLAQAQSKSGTYAMFIGRWQPWHAGHRWLIDQGLLAQRLRETNDEYLVDQAENLEELTAMKICSTVMIDIMRDRVARWKSKCNSTPKTKNVGSEDSANVGII